MFWDEGVLCDVDEEICLLERLQVVAVADFANDLGSHGCDLVLVNNNSASNRLCNHQLAVPISVMKMV